MEEIIHKIICPMRTASDDVPYEQLSYNWNRSQAAASARICRWADIADFVNQTEVIAFYLDHLARIRHHAELRANLEDHPTEG